MCFRGQARRSTFASPLAQLRKTFFAVSAASRSSERAEAGRFNSKAAAVEYAGPSRVEDMRVPAYARVVPRRFGSQRRMAAHHATALRAPAGISETRDTVRPRGIPSAPLASSEETGPARFLAQTAACAEGAHSNLLVAGASSCGACVSNCVSTCIRSRLARTHAMAISAVRPGGTADTLWTRASSSDWRPQGRCIASTPRRRRYSTFHFLRRRPCALQSELLARCCH